MNAIYNLVLRTHAYYLPQFYLAIITDISCNIAHIHLLQCPEDGGL